MNLKNLCFASMTNPHSLQFNCNRIPSTLHWETNKFFMFQSNFPLYIYRRMRINMNNIMQWQYVWLKISSNQDIEQAPTMRTIKGNTEFVVVVHHYKQVIGLRILFQSNFFLLKCLCFIIMFKSSSWTATNLYLYLHSKKQAEKKRIDTFQ